MYIGPAGAVSLLPLPQGTVRIAGPVSPEALDRDSELSTRHFQETVDTLGFGPALRFERVDRIAHYQVHERLAERFTHGRTVLAGDAAHLNSPAGGQAMNTGFGDAWALAWRLDALLTGPPAPSSPTTTANAAPPPPRSPAPPASSDSSTRCATPPPSRHEAPYRSR